LLGISIGGEPPKGLQKAMAGMVLVPGAVTFAQSLKQLLLFLEVPLCV
jgi:hypothetical protein